eukprot:TRINITY_DN11448_c0_g1_i2.p5 TRINITY_DN11448_c0_g1~~TRINITY_DN11448_c0_g1_i2.p5  ORF type:complete len:107 (-),score=9.43 TRINITY_DN11448_c0_g1_i2:791-1111(-)
MDFSPLTTDRLSRFPLWNENDLTGLAGAFIPLVSRKLMDAMAESHFLSPDRCNVRDAHALGIVDVHSMVHAHVSGRSEMHAVDVLDLALVVYRSWYPVQVDASPVE